MEKIKKIQWADPEENASQMDRQTDRQTDGQMNRSDFIGTIPQKWRFNHVSQKFRIKSP